MNKTLLKTIGVLNLVFGILFTLTVIGCIIGIPLIVSGSIFLDYSSLDDSKLIEKKNTIKVWSIVFIFINIVSSILGFCCLNNINKVEKGEKYDPSSFRINFLLYFGMLLILLSGIIFANTSWSLIEDYLKSILLLIFGIIFLFISTFLSKKESLKQTSIVYLLMAIVMFILSFYSCGYFGLFGDYLVILGPGHNLFISMLTLISSSLFYLTYKRTNYKFFGYLSFFGIIISVIYLVLHFINSIEGVSIAYFVLLFILNFVTKKGLNKFFNVITFISFIYIFILNIVSNDTILMLICNICYIANLISLYVTKKNLVKGIFNIILLPIILFLYCYKFLDLNLAVIMCSVAIIIYFILFYIFRNKHSGLFVTSIVLSNIALFVNYIISYFTNCFYTPLVVSILLFAIYVPLAFEKESDTKYLGELIVQPIKLLLLCIAFSYALNSCSTSFSFLSHIVIWSNALLVFSLFSKNKIIRNIYFVLAYVILLLCFIPSSLSIIFRLNLVFMWIFGLLITLFDKENCLHKVNYIFLLTTLFSAYTTFSSLEFTIQLSLLNIVLYALISYLCRNNKLKCFTTLLFILLPYYNFINLININNSILYILSVIPYLLYIYLFTHIFTNNNKNFSNIFEIVGGLIILLTLIFEGSLEATIFVGVICILMVIYDLLFKKNSLFVIGLTGSIINILLNLFKYIVDIPIWLGLFIGGIAIIVIITVQELKKNK